MTPTERLLFLADALEADAANENGMRFDLGCWLMAQEHFTDEELPPRSCGTIGCAMGLACLLPEFQALGLKVRPSGAPWYRDKSEFDAAASFFDIPRGDATFLFSGDRYEDLPTREAAGELAVANRIRQYVAANFLEERPSP